MKSYPTPNTPTPWRGLLDSRSTRPATPPVYKTLLKDRRSTR
jgi:hypothetical protein